MEPPARWVRHREGRQRSQTCRPGCSSDVAISENPGASGCLKSGYLARRRARGRSRISLSTNASRSASGAPRRARTRARTASVRDSREPFVSRGMWSGRCAPCVSDAALAGAGHSRISRLQGSPTVSALHGRGGMPPISLSCSHVASASSLPSPARDIGLSPRCLPTSRYICRKRALRPAMPRFPEPVRRALRESGDRRMPSWPHPSCAGAASSPPPAMLLRIRVSEMTFCMP